MGHGFAHPHFLKTKQELGKTQHINKEQPKILSTLQNKM